MGKICQSLICGGAHMVDESHDEIDEPRTKLHLTAEDIPGDIRYDKYNHLPVLKDILSSQLCKHKEWTKKTKY